jgi:hypothetical protein
MASMGEGQPPGAVELIKASYNGFFAERFDPAASVLFAFPR